MRVAGDQTGCPGAEAGQVAMDGGPGIQEGGQAGPSSSCVHDPTAALTKCHLRRPGGHGKHVQYGNNSCPLSGGGDEAAVGLLIVGISLRRLRQARIFSNKFVIIN